ncbi:MAG: hypothetical protein DRP08_01135 [Candidatus Aenigmatarchaeota archaeon]|nr:MAG: hypothetical protein DRP08_01135 [Candidatus Aenigmarchaeota archaeon]
MFKYLLRKFVKHAIPALVDGVIQALKYLSSHSNNTIDDKFVSIFIYNRENIIIWLKKNLKKFLK